jgi:hypothetical protein
MAGGKDDPTKPRDAGWYDDPFSATGTGERYWDGKKWGTNERPLGRHSTGVTTEARVIPIKGRRRKGRAGKRRLTGPAAPGRNRQIAVFAGFIALVLAASYVLPRFTGGDDDPRARMEEFIEEQMQGSVDGPPPNSGAEAVPLGTPTNVPTGNGQFEVSLHQPNDETRPVAWDPCRPIHYVVNPQGAPADGVALLQEAIASVWVATGLKFVNDGTTTETPDKQRAAYLPDRYDPERWAPVLVAWSNEAAFPPLAGYVVGAGRPVPVTDPMTNELVFVSGSLMLDTEVTNADRATRKAIMLHELGHLIGLDHTADSSQLMFSEANEVAEYQDGDRRGLALLGTQACRPGV